LTEKEHEVGTRVAREITIGSPVFRTGTITSKYKTAYPSIHGNDPWQYEVAWDDGTTGRGYFAGGLKPI